MFPSGQERCCTRGVCGEGDSCGPHGQDRPDTRSRVACLYFQRGRCMYGDRCRYEHSGPLEHSEEASAGDLTAAPAPGAAWSASSVAWSLRQKTDQAGPESRGANCPALGPGSWDWTQAVEFQPGQPYRGHTAPARTELPVLASVPRETKKLLCRYAAAGRCRYGDDCVYLHGHACDLCGLRALHPTDEAQRAQHRKSCLEAQQRDAELSRALWRSKDLACGICLEVVCRKAEPRQRRFGILPNCNHTYCLQCIRQWRRAKEFDTKVTKACPQCRVFSHFVVPSQYWVEDSEEKQKLTQKYKEEMSSKACVYFDQGRGSCPFGGNCFFKHAYPEGPGEEPPGQGAGASRTSSGAQSGNRFRELAEDTESSGPLEDDDQEEGGASEPDRVATGGEGN